MIHLQALKSNSTLVKGYAEKYDIPENYLTVLWKRAICSVIKDGKKECKPKDKEWGLVNDIFRLEVKKYMSKVNKEVKYKIKNPKIKGKKVSPKYEEARKKALKKVINEYRKEIKDCCKKCPSVCKTKKSSSKKKKK